MTVNSSRSMNGDLFAGATDGKYRKVRPNTTVAPGMGEQVMIRDRDGLQADFNYGYVNQESSHMVNPGSV